jgi:4-hydroxy-3-polyprenylbenzoate decarboxylase
MSKPAAHPSQSSRPRPRIVVALTGASGAIYGIRLLETLRRLELAETHLIITTLGKRTISTETDWSVAQVARLADAVHDNRDLGAPPASGSFRTAGMFVTPCSLKTLAAVASGIGDSLAVRAADVTLKEGRPLLLLVRETPLHVGHLRQMVAVAEAGAIVMPPVPAFYERPRTIDDLVDHTVRRAIERLGLAPDLVREWDGAPPPDPTNHTAGSGRQ